MTDDLDFLMIECVNEEKKEKPAEEKPKFSIFDIINNLNLGHENLIDKYGIPQFKKVYDTYFVNKYYMSFEDTHDIVYNLYMYNYFKLDELRHYKILLSSIPKKRRFVDMKRNNDFYNLSKCTEAISIKYTMSMSEARGCISLFSEDQLKQMVKDLKIEKTDKGGWVNS